MMSENRSLIKHKKQWFSELNWRSNPFTLEIYTQSFIPQKEEIEKIINGIEDHHKHILITGPTGIGKTTLLKWIDRRYDSFYIPKPPVSEKEIITVFQTKLLKKGVLNRLFSKNTNLNLYNLTEEYNKRYKGKHILLLVDEAHETRVQTLEWIRSLTDQMEGMTLILTGLPALRSEYLKHLETFMQRMSADIELRPLSKEETIDLIKKRISIMGGTGLEPFTLDAALEIYNHTGGFPREILKMCNNLIDKAAEKNEKIIDLTLMEKDVHHSIPQKKEKIKIDELTDKQKDIIQLISDRDPMTPGEIIKNIPIDDYKSSMHALRGINNILKRLVDMKFLTREKRGKTYVYNITPEVKTILVKA